MDEDEVTRPVTEFRWVDGPEIENGEWTWCVTAEGKRLPHFRCLCGRLMHAVARFTIASDGLIASPRGRGFNRCTGGCSRRPGKMYLLEWADHGPETLPN